ncbi:MAG: AbrB/MazE/SpoVT family DNA-binding domain-containing protein [Nanoarchaeota archaeon]|nr:AbrB/MazE/SpoVT family DNA-binding domain-containing protein [Nanoarchaeota archaeon]
MNHMKDKHIFGTVKVGERGQVVIPKQAREMFKIGPGDSMVVLGKKHHGIVLVKATKMKEFAMKILKGIGKVD